MASGMLRVSAIEKSLPLTIFEDEVMFTDSAKCRTRLRVLFDNDVIFNVSDMFFILPLTKLLDSLRPTVSATFRAISLTVPLNERTEIDSDIFFTIFKRFNFDSIIATFSAIFFILPPILSCDIVILIVSLTRFTKFDNLDLASDIPSVSTIDLDIVSNLFNASVIPRFSSITLANACVLPKND